jgi:UDP-hydrolysing UDP-N-acetyl-D-glucosamine 2-epimerase
VFERGVGGALDLTRPFLLVSQHPVTTEYGEGEHQITETLKAVRDVGLPAIVLWPNADAGSEEIARGIRKLRERGLDNEMHFFKNLPTETYIRLMDRTACLIGNSSSAIREGPFIGTPAVNIGSRQTGRDRGANVLDVTEHREAIAHAIRSQLNHGRYERETLYGDGHAGERIAEILSWVEPKIQKRITY